MAQMSNQSPKSDPLDEAIPLDDVQDDLGVVRKHSAREDRDGDEFHKDFSDAVYDENELAAQEIGLGLGLAEDETDKFEGTTLLGGSFIDEPDSLQLSNEDEPFKGQNGSEKKKPDSDDEFADDDLLLDEEDDFDGKHIK